MHYDVYSEDDKVAMYHWKMLPQFAGLTEQEIRAIMAKINREEERQYNAEVDAKIKKQRADDAAYLEKNDDKNVLPKESVKLDFGVKITFNLVDDHGFVSNEDLSSQRRTMKLSLDEKKKIYL